MALALQDGNKRKDFFLNNRPGAPIIQIYSVIKLYMFRASSLPSSGVFYCTGQDRSQFQPDSAWKRSSKPA